MSELMSVDKDDFKELESEVSKINNRLIPIEKAIPSIDNSLKQLTTVMQTLTEGNARQDEINKNTNRRLDTIEDIVKNNASNITKILIYLAAGAGGYAAIAKVLGI